MAQIVIRFFYLKYSIVVDFILVYIGIWIHQFLDVSTVIDYEKRKYDTIFILTCIVLFSRIVLNFTVIKDKKMIENENKRLNNEKLEQEVREMKLKNDKLEIENEKMKNS